MSKEKIHRYRLAAEALQEIIDNDGDETLRPTLIYLNEQRKSICRDYFTEKTEDQPEG